VGISLGLNTVVSLVGSHGQPCSLTIDKIDAPA